MILKSLPPSTATDFSAASRCALACAAFCFAARSEFSCQRDHTKSRPHVPQNARWFLFWPLEHSGASPYFFFGSFYRSDAKDAEKGKRFNTECTEKAREILRGARGKGVGLRMTMPFGNVRAAGAMGNGEGTGDCAVSIAASVNFTFLSSLFSVSILLTRLSVRFCRRVRGFACACGLRRIFLAAGLGQ